MDIKDLASSHSHAALISEVTDQRRDLRELIAACKKIMVDLPEKSRRELLAVVMEVERKLSQ